jgi:hypothetical protein
MTKKRAHSPKPPARVEPMSASTAEREIIRAARRLTRLQRERRALLGRLKEKDGEIRLAKRELRALTQSVTGTGLDEQTPPLREFGETGGVK